MSYLLINKVKMSVFVERGKAKHVKLFPEVKKFFSE